MRVSVHLARCGYAAIMWRTPVRLYDHGLGWLLGRRFLCLTHRGRTSGKQYRAVLEVLAIDGDEIVVIAGLGPTTDWFRNLHAGSPARIEIGRAAFAAEHRVLGPDEAAAVIADYERRHRWVRPVVRRVLTALVGWHYDGSPAARDRLVRQLPLVAFRPTISDVWRGSRRG
ncbi:nitroreductase family deazaflavin-dependent oxidoreductase [Mycobacterium sp. M26]|uniref:nitroreductase family deazaflavin-dependent oxidoreductase n=1 Tax=Mycobacterium sp. M26 TaxID=1762962 RepID=UPI000B0455E7|nr:nitroreductase family deazaflavin-dependent oxidoreductase [Mycobacterium sp. M26]